MRIESEDICTGMIILGKDTVSIYSNSGVAWECDGEVVFEGKCYIGNASAILVRGFMLLLRSNWCLIVEFVLVGMCI